MIELKFHKKYHGKFEGYFFKELEFHSKLKFHKLIVKYFTNSGILLNILPVVYGHFGPNTNARKAFMFSFEFIVRYWLLFQWIFFPSHFSFPLFVNSWIVFINIIYVTNLVERLCGGLIWEWFPCAVVPKAFFLRFHHGCWIWETREFVASYQFCLKTFDDVIGLKNVVDDASLWHRRIGSKMGFEERTTLMTATMFERKAWSWNQSVSMLTRLAVWMGHNS